jgi:uncharacterized protein (DUF433 family)
MIYDFAGHAPLNQNAHIKEQIMNTRIQINPRICHGKPVIRGIRVLVSTLLSALAAGDDIKTILEDYPNVSNEDVSEALRFAGQLSLFEEIPYETIAS